jgi:hypothetical protein
MSCFCSLTERLEQIRESLDDSATSALDHFLNRKQILDDLDAQQKGEKLPEALVGTLHALTGLRAQLLGGLASGLRNDAPDSSLAQRQKVGRQGFEFWITPCNLWMWIHDGLCELLASGVWHACAAPRKSGLQRCFSCFGSMTASCRSELTEPKEGTVPLNQYSSLFNACSCAARKWVCWRFDPCFGPDCWLIAAECYKPFWRTLLYSAAF